MGSARAQPTPNDLTKVSGREYVRLCALSENAYPCLVAVYGASTVNRLLDVIKNQKTYCPPTGSPFPPPNIVATVSAWLKAHPTFLEQASEEGVAEALMAMYPCR
jgi:hypothetical protein